VRGTWGPDSSEAGRAYRERVPETSSIDPGQEGGTKKRKVHIEPNLNVAGEKAEKRTTLEIPFPMVPSETFSRRSE